LKADIKHYFQEVNHGILLKIMKRKINDARVIWLIEQILNNCSSKRDGGGMPLGNLTSQFFANVYLHELDFFVKHKLCIKYYVRYVDDFAVLHDSKLQLEIWKSKISAFVQDNLSLKLHKDKSKITSLSRGIDFVGFRIFYYFKLLRLRNINIMRFRIFQFKEREISEEKILESFQGWNAYAIWADSFRLRAELSQEIQFKFP